MGVTESTTPISADPAKFLPESWEAALKVAARFSFLGVALEPLGPLHNASIMGVSYRLEKASVDAQAKSGLAGEAAPGWLDQPPILAKRSGASETGIPMTRQNRRASP
jgi:hypothetical protein